MFIPIRLQAEEEGVQVSLLTVTDDRRPSPVPLLGDNMMPKMKNEGVSRRTLFKLTGAVATAAALMGKTRQVSAHDLKPDDPLYQYDVYEGIVNRRDLSVRMVFEWPNIQNPILFGNARNALNGFEFSYGVPPEQIQIVIQAYASANAATYDDEIWEKFQFGKLLNITDPETKMPAERNIWAKSSVVEEEPAPTDDASDDADDAEMEEVVRERDHPYYADSSIEGLHKRGVLFLT